MSPSLSRSTQNFLSLSGRRWRTRTSASTETARAGTDEARTGSPRLRQEGSRLGAAGPRRAGSSLYLSRRSSTLLLHLHLDPVPEARFRWRLPRPSCFDAGLDCSGMALRRVWVAQDDLFGRGASDCGSVRTTEAEVVAVLRDRSGSLGFTCILAARTAPCCTPVQQREQQVPVHGAIPRALANTTAVQFASLGFLRFP